MNLTFTVDQTEDGFGYTIFNDGKPWIIQPHEPEEPGFVAMSEARATELAEAFIAQKLSEQAQSKQQPVVETDT